MTAAIVSDLHLGAASGRDLLRQEPVRAALLDVLRDADELVLLGDVLELRQGPVEQAVAAARPVLAEIDAAMSGRRVTLLAGNHDHQLALPLIERVRLEGRQLEPETTGDPPAEGPLGDLASEFRESELRIAYPGVWVRDDVYATHGHYLDVHNTVPSFERLAIGAVQRVTSRLPAGRARPDDYEALVGPVYALAYALAQASRDGRAHARADSSVRLWEAVAGEGRNSIGGRLLGGVAVPAAVRGLNAAGIGPLSADLSGAELRRAALRGMTAMLEHLGIDAPHVVFGHTHRSGPHPGDEGWGGLVNSGSWILEPAFLGRLPRESPYWPGHCVMVPEAGPPELRRIVEELPGGVG